MLRREILPDLHVNVHVFLAFPSPNVTQSPTSRILLIMLAYVEVPSPLECAVVAVGREYTRNIPIIHFTGSRK